MYYKSPIKQKDLNFFTDTYKRQLERQEEEKQKRLETIRRIDAMLKKHDDPILIRFLARFQKELVNKLPKKFTKKPQKIYTGGKQADDLRKEMIKIIEEKANNSNT